MGHVGRIWSVAIVLASGALAHTGGPWLEAWHRAKFGQPTPAEQARVRAEAASSAYRTEPSEAPLTHSQWNEQWFRVKHGRLAPTELERNSSSAYRAEEQTVAPRPVDWTREYIKAKHGVSR